MANDAELYGLRLAIGDMQHTLAVKDQEYAKLKRLADTRIAQFEAVLQQEREASRAQIGKLKNALALEQCHSAGLLAKGAAYRKVIDRAAPDDMLLDKTGLHYSDGAAQKYSDRIYDEAHDDKAASLGLSHRIASDAK